MSNDFHDWVQSVHVTNTLGNGWCVRLDGSDVFDEINVHGVKTRRTLSIAKGLSSESEAKQTAVHWLKDQLKQLEKESE
ncbi:coil containing protein [Vibrio phage 1.118.B._10N.261.49.F6]|nr:coil containing protein [Vibrio phage 1.118.A._10N.261.49.F6]AUR88898.1 coil containing protein [Vibrio phage 1.118.B._10N.261.49.F6]AUR94506.1 coil containing protein [Vibrio phage 1.195.O._10N.286.54.C8]AUR99804.1 coil containing protein [Vibrio phage 1.269.O._10N.286.54.A6]